MIVNAHDVTPEDMARYRETARRLHRAEQAALVVREQEAWGLARRAATLLRESFHAKRVFVFGSGPRDQEAACGDVDNA